MAAKESWASVAPQIPALLKTMTVQNLSAQRPFITNLDRTNAPVQNQSLAEARVPAGGAMPLDFFQETWTKSQ
jgi:hypothetical protein